jgi:uncharacterized protein (DUF983 family)
MSLGREAVARERGRLERLMPAPVMVSLSFAREIPPSAASQPPRDVWPAIRKGLAGRCPACGKGKIFRAYLKVNEECPTCGEELHHQRADDAPPYLTIVVVGHIFGGLLLATEEYWPDAPAVAARGGMAKTGADPNLFGRCRS